MSSMKFVRKLIPHLTIICGMMYVVFFVIDRVNPSMNFIDNDLTKFLLLFMSLITIVNSILLISSMRREQRAAVEAQRRRRRR